ncbi:MAG: hypothetical protein BGO29_05775 [Bacteroidales bacterium 36-12]|nr:MAG: hypothetical protein BGO29_05775 [Bacteroidales bacterium 36-12]
MKQEMINIIKGFSLLAIVLLTMTLNAQQVVVTLEAENGELTLPAKIKEVAGYSGNKYVGDNDPGSSIVFSNVNIDEEGTYEFKTYYTSMQLRSIAVKSNSFTEAISTITKTSEDWNRPPTETMSTYIYLNKGTNTIKITPHPIGQGGPNMDKFEILMTDVELPKPGEFPIILEAETARLFGDLKVKPLDGSSIAGLSGGKYIGDFHQASNSYLQFIDVEIPEEGTYELKVFSMGSVRRLSIKVNQYEKTIITTKNSPNWDNAPASEISTLIYMDKGKNRITLGTNNDNGPNLDKLEIHKTGESISKPKIINLAYDVDITDEAIITAQHNNETFPYINDNNERSIYRISSQTSTQITAECPYPVVLTSYLLSAGLESNEDLSRWVLESSTDGTIWKILTPDQSTDLAGAILFAINRNYSSAASNAARYYRLTAKGNNDVEIAEWQLFGVPYLANTDGKSFPVDITEGLNVRENVKAFPKGSSGDGWSEEFYNLFDRTLNSKYFMNGTKQYYVEIELNKKYTLDYYTLTSVDNFPDRDPRKWTFNGYNSEIGWVELDRHTEFTFPSRYATMRFNINSDIGFTRFLLDVEDNNGSADSQLLKWQLFGNEYTETSVETVSNKDYAVWGSAGKIHILPTQNAPINFRIYNLSGIVLKNSTLSTSQEISLPQGIYIVALNNGTTNYNIKVIVK